MSFHLNSNKKLIEILYIQIIFYYFKSLILQLFKLTVDFLLLLRVMGHNLLEWLKFYRRKDTSIVEFYILLHRFIVIVKIMNLLLFLRIQFV